MSNTGIDLVIYEKLLNYCNYRERAESEVLNKLMQLDVDAEHCPLYLDELREDGLLDDARFAKNYAQGKSRIKAWGRDKIRMHLKALKVASDHIDQALKAIHVPDYEEKLGQLAERKLAQVKGKSDHEKKAKVFRYLRQKGFESQLIHKVLFQ